MIHSSLESLEKMIAGGPTPDAIDDLAYTSALGADPLVQNKAREAIQAWAREKGAIPSSILPLYAAIGRGEVKGFTVPAVNLRTLTYDTARALFRAAMRHDAGAFIFEIARSEMNYTAQRPAEYAASVLAAALREGWRGPVFIQGDHFQTSAKKWAAPEGKAAEISAIEALIDEALSAGFFNIDIDSSTLVDLGLPTRDEQQKENYAATAHFAEYIRSRQNGEVVSIGGEIGEVGKHNTQPDEVRAYLEGLKRELGGTPGIAKISVQTGTSHGGVVLPDGSIAKVDIDFKVLEEVTAICREEYGIAGSVQHGASTLPEEVFNHFPEHNAVEVHLATGFQTMVLDAPSFPPELKQEINDLCFAQLAEERKEGETDEQFVYKARKKAMGPMKRKIWEMPAEAKGPIVQALEAKFEFLLEKLGVVGTKEVVAKYVPAAAGAPAAAGPAAAPNPDALGSPDEGE